MVKNPEHNEIVHARLEAFLLALADTYPESREYVKEVWRRVAQAQPVPEGADADLVADMLTQYAIALDYGELDGAGRYFPSDIQEQADLLAAAPKPGGES